MCKVGDFFTMLPRFSFKIPTIDGTVLSPIVRMLKLTYENGSKFTELFKLSFLGVETPK